MSDETFYVTLPQIFSSMNRNKSFPLIFKSKEFQKYKKPNYIEQSRKEFVHTVTKTQT